MITPQQRKQAARYREQAGEHTRAMIDPTQTKGGRRSESNRRVSHATARRELMHKAIALETLNK